VAIAACGLGTILALRDGYGSPWLALLIVATGILLQAAVNLINDHADLPMLEQERAAADPGHRVQVEAVMGAIRRNFRIGVLFLAIAFLIGLGLVWVQGWLLLFFVVVGLLGAYYYSAEPIHYKRRGLGVVLVFWLMGVLLVGGSALAMGAPLTLEILLISVPFSLLTSLVLLGNEIRDQEADRRNGLRTLTVRIGPRRARQLFFLMLLAIYLSSLLLWWGGLVPYFWPQLLSLPLAWPAARAVWREDGDRRWLPQQTGRLFAVFALLFMLEYLVDGWLGGYF
jgi:1,4-dihydroxy-2-naphthoate octaprenyltransferase